MGIVGISMSGEKEKAQIKDAICLIAINEDKLTNMQLHYKLLQCGIHITHPELDELINEIEADGLLTRGNQMNINR